jgi:drug/metabolite transporter (DMT)-like permease
LSASRSGILAIIGAATLWGVSGALAKWFFTSTSIPPLLLSQVRLGLSALFLFIWFGLTNRSLLRFPKGELRFLLIWGIAGLAMVQYTYMASLSLTNVATAVFLQYLSPVVTALWGGLTGSERLSGRLLLCLAVACGGSTLLLFSGGGLKISTLGLVVGLTSAIAMAANSVISSKSSKHHSPWGMLAWGMLIGFLFWLVVDIGMAVAGRPLQGLDLLFDPPSLGYFGYLALFATIIPFGLFTIGLGKVGPTVGTMTAMMEPVVASAAAFLLLHEAMAPLQMVGGALILAAVILLQAGRRNGIESPSAA